MRSTRSVSVALQVAPEAARLLSTELGESAQATLERALQEAVDALIERELAEIPRFARNDSRFPPQVACHSERSEESGVAPFLARCHSERSEESQEISVYLTTDAEIREFNRAYRGVDKATDVLSFCYTSPPTPLSVYGEGDPPARGTGAPPSPLTEREDRGVRYIAQGLSPLDFPSLETRDGVWYTEPELWELLKPLARQTRREPTPAEKHLWKYLRNRQMLGFRFRRQHTIERFVVDFYCHEAKLVIEVDSEIHDYTPEEDRIRQAFLEFNGFRVIRFRNEEVLHRTQDVLAQIERVLRGNLIPEKGTLPAYNLTAHPTDFSDLTPPASLFVNRDGGTEAPHTPSFPSPFTERGTGGEGGIETPLGDIVISVETALRQAAPNGHDLLTELLMLALHGTLHLMGYDDSTETGRATMNARAVSMLRRLGYAAREEWYSRYEDA